MLYNVESKNMMSDTLKNRVSNIVNLCIHLVQEGYNPNNAKSVKLSWASIMIDACYNMDVFSSEQHTKIEQLYSKVMAL